MEAAPERPQGTVTFLFTDIERSTQLARELGAEFGPLRAEHRRLLREAFARHDGHEIDTAGDGFFVVFDRAGDAVAAAVDAQRTLVDAESGALARRVRMGLHTTEPYLHDESYVGVGVHRAARICAAGHGGQILLSNATAGVLEDLGPQGVELRDLGEHRLKDIERPQRLFQLVVEGLPSEFPPPAGLDAAASGPAIVTLAFVDMAGWRGVLRSHGDEAVRALTTQYQELAQGAVQAHGGRVVEASGDNVLAAFDRPSDALAAAALIRDAMRSASWAVEHGAGVSIGVHSGHVSDATAPGYGAASLHAFRLWQAAEPWQILVSHATEALLEGELTELELHDLGERTLPDFERPAHVYELASSSSLRGSGRRSRRRGARTRPGAP